MEPWSSLGTHTGASPAVRGIEEVRDRKHLTGSKHSLAKVPLHRDLATTLTVHRLTSNQVGFHRSMKQGSPFAVVQNTDRYALRARATGTASTSALNKTTAYAPRGNNIQPTHNLEGGNKHGWVIHSIRSPLVYNSGSSQAISTDGTTWAVRLPCFYELLRSVALAFAFS